MFDTPSDQSDKEKKKEIEAQMNEKGREVPNIFKDEELDSLKRVLENLESGTHFPTEIKGEFTGEWGVGDGEFSMGTVRTPKDDLETGSGESVRIVAGLPSSALERKESCLLQSDSQSADVFSLYIYSSPTKISGISWLRARIRLEGESVVENYMIGIYIRPFGEIALFPSVANISVSTTTTTSSEPDEARRQRRMLLPADLIRYRERKSGNNRVEALTLLSQDSSSSHKDEEKEDVENPLSSKSKAVPCLFQLHLSLDSVDSKSQISDNIFDDKDGHYVQCSGELYDLDSNATIGVQKVTSYLYVHSHAHAHTTTSLTLSLSHTQVRPSSIRYKIKNICASCNCLCTCSNHCTDTTDEKFGHKCCSCVGIGHYDRYARYS